MRLASQDCAFPWQLDLRSLGLFRIFLAVAVLLDLGSRSLRLSWWYSDDGIVSRALAEAHQGFPVFGFYALFGTTWWAALGVGMTAVGAVLLLVGFRSRLMALFLALMVLSFHTRNPFVLNGSDTVLQLSLIWAVFLPIGARFSLDRGWNAKNPEADPPQSSLWTGIAALGFTSQIGLSYLMDMLYKNGDTWLTGQAVKVLFSVDMYARHPGADLIRQLPDPILTVISFGVLLLEGSALFLLFVPFQRIRLVIVASLMLLHLGFLVTMSIGLFPINCLMWLTALLPSIVWQRCRAGQGITIFYDPGAG